MLQGESHVSRRYVIVNDTYHVSRNVNIKIKKKKLKKCR